MFRNTNRVPGPYVCGTERRCTFVILIWCIFLVLILRNSMELAPVCQYMFIETAVPWLTRCLFMLVL